MRVSDAGRYIVTMVDGRAMPVTVDEYKQRVAERLVAEVPTLERFRACWIAPPERRDLLGRLPDAGRSALLVRALEDMTDYDLYDVLAELGYRRSLPAPASTAPRRSATSTPPGWPACPPPARRRSAHSPASSPAPAPTAWRAPKCSRRPRSPAPAAFARSAPSAGPPTSCARPRSASSRHELHQRADQGEMVASAIAGLAF